MQNIDRMRITVPMAVLTLVVSVIVGVFGWFINNTLNSIDKNINEVRIEIKSLTEKRYDHETRLKIIEQKLNIQGIK